MPQIRCDSRLHGIISDNSIGIFETTCDSGFCRINKEVVVHRWDLEKINEDNTVRPIQTFRLKKPK